MLFSQYIGSLIVVLAGPPIGMLLARIAPDEREMGGTWFILFRYAIIAAFGVLGLWLARDSPLQSSLFAAGVLLFLVARAVPLLEHALVGVAFWFAARHPLPEASLLLLFLLGMVGGTLTAEPKALTRKKFWEAQLQTFIRTAWPVLVALPLYFF